jgi:hypothetical protein
MNAANKNQPLTEAQRRTIESLTPQQRMLVAGRSFRHRSEREFLGLPLVSIAVGPDAGRGELRGHARGVVAIGDIATGIVAIGGWARGLVAIGGLATGAISLGGLSVALLGAVGGVALSALLAFGGGAVGTVAIGGAAVGHYAIGGAAFGTYVAGPARIDPEVVEALGPFESLLPPAARAPAKR